MDTLISHQIGSDDIDALRSAVTEIESRCPESQLAGVLAKLAMQLSQGQDVVLVPVEAELSPAQAASILRMSRPHLCKLLDAGVIPHSRVGRDRRIRQQDVTAFMHKREETRRELAETFARRGEDRTELVAKLAGVDPETAKRLGF